MQKLFIGLITFIILNTVILLLSLLTFFVLFIPLCSAMIYFYDNSDDFSSSYSYILIFIDGFKKSVKIGLFGYLFFGFITSILFTNLTYLSDEWFSSMFFHIVDIILLVWSLVAMYVFIFISAKYKTSFLEMIKISYLYCIYNFGLMVLLVIGIIIFFMFSALTIGFLFIFLPLVFYVSNKLLAKSFKKIFIIE